MSQQTINVGATPNDGSGDTLRAAMQKANANFGELYSGQSSEAIQDMIAAFLQAGQNISISYDDSSNVLTISAGVKNNFNASSAPTPADDASGGYSDGSSWVLKSTGQMWRCRDASTGVAKWEGIDTADHPGYIPGNWYYPSGTQVATGAAFATGSVRLIPFIIKYRVSISNLGARINTAAAGGNAQYAIYGHNSGTGRPTGSALATTANIGTATSGNASATIAGGSITLEPGIYWFGVNIDAAAGTGGVVFQTQNNATSLMTTLVGSPSENTAASGATSTSLCLTVSQAFGTWPDLTSATFSESTGTGSAVLHFKVA
jgi:hypothetical protein